jgi:hypothetical protein
MTIHTNVQRLLVSRRSLSLAQRGYVLGHLENCKQCLEADALFQANAQALSCLHSLEPPAALEVAVLRRLSASRTSQRQRFSVMSRIPKPSRLNRVVVLTMVSLVALLGGLSLATAASPSVRGALQHALPFPLPGSAGAVSDAQGQPIAIYPKPAFAIVYPQPVPTGLIVHFIMHFRHGTPVSGLSGAANCGLDAHPSVCARRMGTLPQLLGIFPGITVSPYFSTLAQPVWKRNIEVVWFGLRNIPPQSRYIELVEWSNRAFPLADYPGSQASGDHITVRQRGSRTTVFLIRDGTAIAVRSNMGRQFTVRFATTLDRIQIAGRSGVH